MCITLESDYAIRIMLFLAKKGVRVDAKTISEQTQVTLRFALKILRKLVSKGLVRSYKGVKGGYELNKNPREINLYEIVIVIEGNCYLSRCLDDSIGCSRNFSKDCKVRRVFGNISEMIKTEMEKTKLQDLM